MDDEIGAACPIADALRPIRRSRAPTDVVKPESCRVDAVETLATLLDLTGSMALAVELESPSVRAPAAATGFAPTTAEDLAEMIEARLEPLAAAIERRLVELPTSRSGIWSAERLCDEMARRGLAGSRRGRGAATLAREASDAYVLAVRGLLDRIRGDLRGLRGELGPRLARCGPGAARLEAFDALVARARSAATHRLIARIPPALAEDFAARLEAAVRMLDPGAPPASLAAWYAGDGWIARFHGEASQLIRGVFEHERTTLVELVAAARDLGACRDATPPGDDVAPGNQTMQTEAGETRP